MRVKGGLAVTTTTSSGRREALLPYQPPEDLQPREVPQQPLEAAEQERCWQFRLNMSDLRQRAADENGEG